MAEMAETAENDVVSESTVTLLWEACRKYPEVGTIRAAVDSGIQPELLVMLALNHRIGPLLWRAMTAAGCADSLGPEGVRLKELSDTFRMQALTLHPHAVALAVAPLTDAGLKPLIMKGPTLMDRYPETGLRPMDDIDLFLPAGDHERAIDVLCASGWTVSRAMTRGLYDTQFRHPGLPSIPLELHLGLEGWHERSNRIEPTWLWEQRIPAEYLGTPAFGLPLEVEVVSLAAHAGKPYHGFDRLIWLADLTMAVTDAQEHGEIDWDRIVELAQATECMTVVTAALHMAARMGLQFPGRLFPLPTTGWRTVPMAKLLRADWPVHHGQGTFHVRFALIDTRWRRTVLFFAGSRNFSWSERIHLPQRATARALEVFRASRHGSSRPESMAQ